MPMLVNRQIISRFPGSKNNATLYYIIVKPFRVGAFLKCIRDFSAMKNPDIMPDKDKIEYMSIEKKAYQNRKKALPLVKELVKGE